MKILIAQHYGLCFGVRDAIAEAERLVQQGPLTILGELVHNPVVRERLKSQGIREGSLDGTVPPATNHVMITAHGASDAAREQWRERGYVVADGTCPLVRHAHEQLRRLVAEGFHPVVIGKRGHIEVTGLTGDFPDAAVIENEEEITALPLRAGYGVISQTTQPIGKVMALVAAMKRTFPASEIRFADTVCQPTKNRQLAMRSLLAQCDTVVVVGGHNSNNTLQLVAAAAAANKTVYHVESAIQLQPSWFQDSETVGVTAGTSTLKETVEEVRLRLEEIASGLIARAA